MERVQFDWTPTSIDDSFPPTGSIPAPYGEERARFDERKLREVYAETDSLAGEILKNSQEAGQKK
jgi:hypothetical protein